MASRPRNPPSRVRAMHYRERECSREAEEGQGDRGGQTGHEVRFGLRIRSPRGRRGPRSKRGVARRDANILRAARGQTNTHLHRMDAPNTHAVERKKIELRHCIQPATAPTNSRNPMPLPVLTGRLLRRNAARVSVRLPSREPPRSIRAFLEMGSSEVAAGLLADDLPRGVCSQCAEQLEQAARLRRRL